MASECAKLNAWKLVYSAPKEEDEDEVKLFMNLMINHHEVMLI